MDTHALVLALRALQQEIRANTDATKGLKGWDQWWLRAVDHHQREADRLMDEAEKAARAEKGPMPNPKLVRKLKELEWLYKSPEGQRYHADDCWQD